MKSLKNDIAKVLKKYGLNYKEDSIYLSEKDKCVNTVVDNNYIRHDTFEKEIVLKVTGIYFRETKLVK